jgi:ribosomal protein L12E/L44/L45/RPP1/RPP2
LLRSVLTEIYLCHACPVMKLRTDTPPWTGAWRTVLTHFSNRHPALPLPPAALAQQRLQGLVRSPTKLRSSDAAAASAAGPAVVGAAPSGEEVKKEVAAAATATEEEEEEEEEEEQLAFSGEPELARYAREQCVVAFDGLRLGACNLRRLPTTLLPCVDAVLRACARRRRNAEAGAAGEGASSGRADASVTHDSPVE